MSTNDMDQILYRWFLDGEFREQLRNDPEQALAGYDLTPEQQARLFKLKKHTLPDKQEAPDFPLTQLNQPFSQN